VRIVLKEEVEAQLSAFQDSLWHPSGTWLGTPSGKVEEPPPPGLSISFVSKPFPFGADIHLRSHLTANELMKRAIRSETGFWRGSMKGHLAGCGIESTSQKTPDRPCERSFVFAS
jgi:hypothetical protein